MSWLNKAIRPTRGRRSMQYAAANTANSARRRNPSAAPPAVGVRPDGPQVGA